MRVLIETGPAGPDQAFTHFHDDSDGDAGARKMGSAVFAGESAVVSANVSALMVSRKMRQ